MGEVKSKRCRSHTEKHRTDVLENHLTHIRHACAHALVVTQNSAVKKGIGMAGLIYPAKRQPHFQLFQMHSHFTLAVPTMHSHAHTRIDTNSCTDSHNETISTHACGYTYVYHFLMYTYG